MRLAEIAARVGGRLDGDGMVEIAGVSSIEEPVPGTLTFLADPKLASRVASLPVAAILLPLDGPSVALPAVRVTNPHLAFVEIVELFHPAVPAAPGVHPTAIIAPTARIGANASIGPHVAIGDGAVVGDDCVLHAGVVLYPRVAIGNRFTAHARAIVREEARIGDRVTIHAGAVVGSDGFGYLPAPDGIRKIPQVGTVVVEDDVEIGANATIDRAALGATTIGRGTKIDNLVMVAHGCRVGPYCLLAGQVGLAGGTTLGAGVMLGGQVGSAGHLTIGDGARVAAKSGIHNDLAAGGTYGGSPAIDVRAWRRGMTALRRLPELFRRVRGLERRAGVADGDSDDA
jgi:UDP-3-O-[3-hydroxymyristoyl] glucosamine N-acyltransferase